MSAQSPPTSDPRPRTARPRGWAFHVLRGTAAAVILAFLVVSAAVGVLTYLLAGGNPRLSSQMVSLLNRSVGTDSTRFEVGRVSGTLFRGAVLDRPRLVVVTPDGDVTWASARRVTIDYDLFGLLFSRNRSLTAVIDSPAVRLVHDRAGRIVFPRFASRPGPRGGGPTTRVLLSARNGTIALDWQRLRFKQVQGRGLLTLAPGRSTLALDELSGLPDPSERARGRVRARGTMVVTGGSLRADPLLVAYGDSRVRSRIDWDLAKGRARDALFTLDPLRVGDVSRLAGAEKLDGRLKGEVSFAGLPTDGRSTACLSGTLNGEPLDTLAATAVFAPRSITFSGLRVRVRGAEATGGGVVQLRGGPAQATLTFHGLDPAAIPWWKGPEEMPRGSVSGTARILVRPTRPKSTVIALVALGQTRFGRLDVRQGSLALMGGADGSTVLDSGWVDVPGGRLAGRARIAPDQTLDAHLVLSVENLAAMNALIAPVVAESGRGRVTADLTGSLRAPDFSARASLVDGRLTSGVAYDSLRATAAGRLGAGGSARATLAAGGIRAGDRALGHASAEVSIGKSIVIERYVQSAGDSSLAFRGTVTLGEHEAKAVLDSVALNAGALRFHNLEPVRLAIAEGHVRTQSLSLDIRPGRLDLSFDWDVKGNRIEAQGAFQGLDVTRLSGAPSARAALRGTARGRFRVAGPISDPAVRLDADLAAHSWSGVQGDSLSIAAEYTPGFLRIDQARWAAGQGRVAVTGAVRAPVSLEAWLRGLAKRDPSWAKNAALGLDVRVDALDLSRLAPADTSLRSLEGTASLTARITGSAQEPVLAIQGSAPRLVYRGLEGAVSGAELAYSNQVLRLVRCDVSQGGSVSSVTGEVPADLSLFAKERLLRDRPLHLTFRVSDADFRLASVIYPAYVAASGGRMSVMAGVSGTPRNPEVQGTVRLKDASIRLAGREEVVQKIELEGTFDQNQLTVTTMEGVQGTKGRIAGSGTWRWGGLAPGATLPVAAGPPGRYQFKVNASNFTVTDRETYLMQLTGTFAIANGRTVDGRQIPRITGAATLAKGNLTLDLAAERQEFTLPFYYDVNVEVPGGLFYRTVDSEVELQGTLRLMNSGDGNLALGTMTVRKGRYYLFTREIRNLTGDFVFNSLDRTDPELAVDGETTVPSSRDPVTIKVSLTGRASRPVVHLWDPNRVYSEADLWRMITVGQVPFASSPEGENGNGTSPELSPFIQAYLFRNAERWLTESGWIDTFDLRTGARTGGTPGSGTGTGSASGVTGNGPLDIGLVGAGKYVTRDLYVNYSREFSGSEAQRIGAEYRVTRHLLLKGERTFRSNATPNLPAEEYNLDLKVRLEY